MQRNKDFDSYVRTAERYLKAGHPGHVIRVTSQALNENWKSDPRLWRLKGVAEGSLGNHWEACESFWKSLCLIYDDFTMANYITSLFALGYMKRATWLTQSTFDSMPTETQNIVIHSVIEGLRVRDLERDLLCESILARIDNIYPILS